LPYLTDAAREGRLFPEKAGKKPAFLSILDSESPQETEKVGVEQINLPPLKHKNKGGPSP